MADIDLNIITDIEGLDELEEAFTGGSKRAVYKFLRKVEMDAAQVLVTALEENAPYEDGELANSIHRQTVRGDGTLTVRVGPDQQHFYGAMQEFGAPEANVPAQHWAEQAAKSVQDEVLDKFYDGLREGLEDMKG